MMAAVREYFADLSEAFGQGWNRFWFTPGDATVLCVLRIAFAAIAIYAIASFTPDLVTFFGADGILTVETVAAFERQTQQFMQRQWQLSYLDYFTSPSDLYAVHAAGLAVLALFGLGLFTRVTSVLSLAVVVSYINRAPILTSQAEPVIAFVIAYLCLGPCGKCCSLDAWLRGRRSRGAASVTQSEPPGGPRPNGPQASWAATVSLRLIQVHLAVVYASLALGKLYGTAWYNGSASWWLITKAESRLIDLTWLHSWPLLINAWTHEIVAYELAFCALIWNSRARPLLLVFGVVHWGLLALLTGLVTYALAMLAASLAFAPPGMLRRLRGRPAEGATERSAFSD